MDSFSTAQENFWAGEFGDEYSRRNVGQSHIGSSVAFYGRILSRTRGVTSAIEFGANIGINLRALRSLLPDARLTGVEINKVAADELRAWGGAEVIQASILSAPIKMRSDFSFVHGVLIHVNPDDLKTTYDKIAHASSRYVCISEYYNPSPIAIPYRGHSDRLFKRDFAGEFLDANPDFSLVDYGFVYHRDPIFPQDDLTWFLLARR